MKIGMLITARLKSERLPLKVLLPLGNNSVIDHVILRAKKISFVDEVILCTSSNPQDKPLSQVAQTHGIPLFNGHAEDVLQRLYDAATFHRLDYILSVTADNPFFSIEYANQVANEAILHNPDYMTVDGLPLGLALHGIRYEALKTIIRFKEETDSDTEIWGQWFLQPKYFNNRILKARPEEFRSVRLTLDTFEDYMYLHELYKKCEQETASLQSILDAIDQLPRKYEVHRHVQQKQLPDDQIQKINRLFNVKSDQFLKLKDQIYKKKEK